MKTKMLILFVLVTLCLSKEEVKPQLISEKRLNDIFSYPIDVTPTFDEVSAVVDKNEVDFDDTVTQRTVIDEMGFGWNLGNTLEAFNGKLQNEGLDSETCWGVDKTSEEIIEGLVTKGFKAIRVPVSWHNHLVDNSYTIDPEWMKRVKTVVDWSLSKGLYVILNTHHDNAEKTKGPIGYGKGYYPSRKDLFESSRFLFNVWKQIATAFNNGYDHHLIFESLNEPRPIGTDCEWTFKKGDPVCEEAASCLNDMNRLIVKAIRETGGNNEKRFILLPAVAASYLSATTSDFIFPADHRYNPTNPKILLSVHMYTPYNFAMNPDMTFTTFQDAIANELYSDFKDLYERFALKGHHVIIGEMGTVNKNNTDDRIAWAKYFVETSRKFHLSALIWDNQVFDNSKSAAEIFGSYHRKDLTWENDTYINTYIEASKTDLVDNPPEEFKDSFISEPMEFNDWSLNLFIGGGALSTFNSYSRLVIATDDPTSFKPAYRALILFMGDWSDKYAFSADEVDGATPNGDGGFVVSPGGNAVFTFNDKNMQIAKERGIFIIGYGFTITKIFVSGPKLGKMEPLTLTKSKEKQKVNFFFSENATDFADKITFVNQYHDLNQKVKCAVDKEDDKLVVCEGVFDFTGEYKVADDNGVLLSTRALNVVPPKGEKYDIDNLIGCKYNFDVFNMMNGLLFLPEYFVDVHDDSLLVIETSNLSNHPSYKVLFFFIDVGTPLVFNASDVNVAVGGDGGLIIPEGDNNIVINLKNYLKVIKEYGLSLKGYGFSVKNMFIINEKKEEKKEEDKEKTSKR